MLEDAVGDQLSSLRTLDEDVEPDPVAEVIGQSIERLRCGRQHAARLRPRQGGIQIPPLGPERGLHPGVPGHLGGRQRCFLGGQSDACVLERGLEHRDRVAQPGSGELEALLTLSLQLSVRLLVQGTERTAREWLTHSIIARDLLHTRVQRTRREAPSSLHIDRQRVEQLGRRGLVQAPLREPIADQARIQQGRKEQRLVRRVAGARLERAQRAPEDARVRLVRDLVRHEPEDGVKVVAELERQVRDRIGLDLVRDPARRPLGQRPPGCRRETRPTAAQQDRGEQQRGEAQEGA